MTEATLRGILQHNVPLKDFTSWRVGGPAKRFYIPADKADLAKFIQSLDKDEPLLWLGLGSNLLVNDQGFDGTVIFTQKNLDHLEVQKPNQIYAEAGVSCGTLARFIAKNQLGGGEFFAGIPGTVGGALRMNAGCHGDETWRHVIWVETLDRSGQITQRSPAEFEVAYRHTAHPRPLGFIAALFEFPSCESQAALEKIKTLLAHRKATQPINLPNCGSVFRNPPGQFAAKLIESCNLKGYQIGEARVSEKHANFIINVGQATAQDIVSLIEHIQTTVRERHGIDLIPEVHRI